MRVFGFLAAVAGLGLICGVAWAQDKPKSEIQIITDQLQSADESEKQAGMTALEAAIADQPDEVLRKLVDWSRPMAAAGMHDRIDAMALRGILESPGSTSRVIDMQKLRISALTAQGEHERALAEAKRLFNVTSMRATELAVETVAEALIGARAGDEPGIVRRFKEQQAAGSGQQAGEEPVEEDLGENILKTIHLDTEPYEEAIAATMTSNSFSDLFARGNLLLLADRSDEARGAFELAIDLANNERDLIAALEGVARSIRAAEGTIGGANAYILSLRSATESASGAE